MLREGKERGEDRKMERVSATGTHTELHDPHRLSQSPHVRHRIPPHLPQRQPVCSWWLHRPGWSRMDRKCAPPQATSHPHERVTDERKNRHTDMGRMNEKQACSFNPLRFCSEGDHQPHPSLTVRTFHPLLKELLLNH